MGWFYGFKLHWVVNDRGELLAFQLTPDNVDARRLVPELTRGSKVSPKSSTPARSIANLRVNLLAGLMAYTQQPLKPSLNLTNPQQALLNEPL